MYEISSKLKRKLKIFTAAVKKEIGIESARARELESSKIDKSNVRMNIFLKGVGDKKC
jgi:hypothetical protein